MAKIQRHPDNIERGIISKNIVNILFDVKENFVILFICGHIEFDLIK